MRILLIILILAALVPLSSGVSCLTSSEDYAIEVVVTNYNLFNLRKLAEKTSDGFVLQSQYNSDLLTILRETDFPQGLSLKLQIPTKFIEISDPHLKFASYSAKGKLRELNTNSFGFWRVSCTEGFCEFTKDYQKVSVKEIGQEQEVTVEINEALEKCYVGCSGACINTPTESKCIESKMKNEFDTILKYSGVTNEFTDLLDSYRIIGSEDITLLDLQPEINPYINWQEAMRQELVFITTQGVFELTRDDIESIVSLSKRGQAGQNYRIVYDFKNQTWVYYDKTSTAILTNQRDCREYSKIESVRPSPKKLTTFYTVPLIITGIALVFMLVLVVIAKAIRSKSK